MMKRKQLLPIQLLIILLLSGCCGEIDAGKQKVNVQPLYEAQLSLNGVEKVSDIIDINIFDQVEIEEDTYILARWAGPTEKIPGIDPASSIDIAILLSTDTETAGENFNLNCNSWLSTGVEFNGEEGNQYCISRLLRLRGDPEGLCLPTNQYESLVVFQKDRLVITIYETIYSETGKGFNFSKDDVILLLAQELSK